MPNVEDFLKQFTSAGQRGGDASSLIDRFVSNHPDDRDFDRDQMVTGSSEYLQGMPDSEFQPAAQTAFANAAPDQQQSLVQSLVKAVQSQGSAASGLRNLLPGMTARGIDASQYAQLANTVRRQHPAAMQHVLREQPWFLKALGNPVVMGALGMVASRMMQTRQRPPSTPRAGGMLGKILG